jgi:hypothetical protein
MPCKPDPAEEIIAALVTGLTDAFTGTECPPLVGNVGVVRLFAGDGLPLAAWDAHASGGCDAPFIWIRPKARYRSHEFPAPTIDTSPCRTTLTRVLAAEVGVAWCAVVEQNPDWADYAAEAANSLDVSRRIEIAICKASTMLGTGEDGEDRLVGTDTLAPYGPDGGVIAWTSTFYSSY